MSKVLLKGVLFSGVSAMAIALQPAGALEKTPSPLPSSKPTQTQKTTNPNDLIIHSEKQSQTIEEAIKVLQVLEANLQKSKTGSQTTLKMAAEIKEQIADQKAQIKILKEKNTAACNGVKTSVDTHKLIGTSIKNRQEALDFSPSSPKTLYSGLAGGCLSLLIRSTLVSKFKTQSKPESKPEKPKFPLIPVALFIAGAVASPPAVHWYDSSLLSETKANYEQLTAITNKGLTGGQETLKKICK